MAFIMPWIRPPARYCQRFLHLSSLQVFRLLSPLPKRALLPLVRSDTPPANVNFALFTTFPWPVWQNRRCYHSLGGVLPNPTFLPRSPAPLSPETGHAVPWMVQRGAPGGAPGPCAVAIPSDLPCGGRKSGNAVGIVSRSTFAVVKTCELTVGEFGEW